MLLMLGRLGNNWSDPAVYTITCCKLEYLNSLMQSEFERTCAVGAGSAIPGVAGPLLGGARLAPPSGLSTDLI